MLQQIMIQTLYNICDKLKEMKEMILKFLHLWFLGFSFSSVSPATILPGSTLTADNPDQIWTSADSTFSLRFITNVISNQETHFAAITYGDIPIWVAGGSSASGGAADSSASFQFVVDGNLRLVNGSDGAIVWQSNTGGRGVNSATLDDSGNFTLENGTITLWSTFENPTDTLLPYQNFTVDSVLRSGLYSFQIHRTGNLALRWNNTFEYWNLGLNSSINSNLSSPTLQLIANGILNLLDPMLSTSISMVTSSDYGEGENIIRFVKLDSDGNLRIYSSTRNGDSKTIRWAALSDQCQVFGYCGKMGICSYENTNPICRCPSKNFEAVDPKDGRRGCQRKIELEDCRTSQTMLRIDNSQFLTYQPSEIFTMGIVACESNCLQSDACVASTSLADGTGVCYLKQPAFISGRQLSVVPSTSFVKVCRPADPYPMDFPKKSKGWIIHGRADVVVIIGTILGLVVLEGGLCLFCCRNRCKLSNHSVQYTLTEYASGAPIQFSYKDLQHATKGFREKLGVGGFGSVYRGVLVNKTMVAVKQLEGLIEQGEKQFRMEVATISNTHHLNLVRLIGFCSEGRHRLLVYEFLKNGSLDNFLFPAEENKHMEKFLNWDQRFNIALGTAKGITYLHEECRDCIVHCDIKPENILLDDSYNSKVSDFGLAKLVNPKDHRTVSINVRGTRGYLAPEWLADLPTTSKSDVYSYGMVLLEIVSGRRNFEVFQITDKKKFSIWAYEEFEKQNLEGIIDKRIQESNNFDMEQIKRAIQVSFWCIQEHPSQRPMMGKVVQMLEGVLDVEMPPAPLVTVEGGLVTESVSVKPSNNVNLSSTLAPSTSNSNLPFQITRNMSM